MLVAVSSPSGNRTGKPMRRGGAVHMVALHLMTVYAHDYRTDARDLNKYLEAAQTLAPFRYLFGGRAQTLAGPEYMQNPCALTSGSKREFEPIKEAAPC